MELPPAGCCESSPIKTLRPAGVERSWRPESREFTMSANKDAEVTRQIADLAGMSVPDQ